MLNDQSQISTEKPMVREAVAVFDNVEDLRETIVDLQQNGFMRQELGFIADDQNVREKTGKNYGWVEQVKHDPHIPRADFMPDEPVGEVEAALIGVPFYIAAVLASGVAIVQGANLPVTILVAVSFGLMAAICGAYFSSQIAAHHQKYISEQVKRGGLLLWVHLRSPQREAIVREILTRHAARNVEMHTIPLHS